MSIRDIIRRRVFWYFAGLLTPVFCGLIWFCVFGIAPETAMDWTGYSETTKTNCFLDYTETIKAKGTIDDFRSIVRAIRLGTHRVSDTEYAKGDGETVIGQRITFEDGWIIYNEWAK